MNDIELIKAAAIGVGYTPGPSWNPIDDDGDALRLLAAMPSLWWLKLVFGAPTVEMNIAWGTGGEKTDKIAREFAGQGADRATAIRRAIVRAAAQLPPNFNWAETYCLS